MNDLWQFVTDHFWLVFNSGFAVSVVLGFTSSLNPNNFSRRLGRAGEAFWKVLFEDDGNTRGRE